MTDRSPSLAEQVLCLPSTERRRAAYTQGQLVGHSWRNFSIVTEFRFQDESWLILDYDDEGTAVWQTHAVLRGDGWRNDENSE